MTTHDRMTIGAGTAAGPPPLGLSKQQRHKPGNQPIPVVWRAGVLAVVGFVIVPATTLALGFAFGALLAKLENWDVFTGGLYMLSNLTGLGTPLTSARPTTDFGIAADIIISAWALAVVGTVVGTYSNLTVMPTLIHKLEGQRTRLSTPPLARQLGAYLLLSMVIAPALMLLVAALLGAGLAAEEGWSTREGVLYMMSTTVGLADPLVDVSPTTRAGQVLDIAVSLWTVALVGATLSAVSSMSFPATCARVLEYALIHTESALMPRWLSATSLEALRRDALKSREAVRAPELHALLVGGGLVRSEAQAQRIFELFDLDGSGLVDKADAERVAECLRIAAELERRRGGAEAQVARGGAWLLAPCWPAGGDAVADENARRAPPCPPSEPADKLEPVAPAPPGDEGGGVRGAAGGAAGRTMPAACARAPDHLGRERRGFNGRDTQLPQHPTVYSRC